MPDQRQRKLPRYIGYRTSGWMTRHMQDEATQATFDGLLAAIAEKRREEGRWWRRKHSAGPKIKHLTINGQPYFVAISYDDKDKTNLARRHTPRRYRLQRAGGDVVTVPTPAALQREIHRIRRETTYQYDAPPQLPSPRLEAVIENWALHGGETPACWEQAASFVDWQGMLRHDDYDLEGWVIGDPLRTDASTTEVRLHAMVCGYRDQRWPNWRAQDHEVLSVSIRREARMRHLLSQWVEPEPEARDERPPIFFDDILKDRFRGIQWLGTTADGVAQLEWLGWHLAARLEGSAWVATAKKGWLSLPPKRDCMMVMALQGQLISIERYLLKSGVMMYDETTGLYRIMITGAVHGDLRDAVQALIADDTPGGRNPNIVHNSGTANGEVVVIFRVPPAEAVHNSVHKNDDLLVPTALWWNMGRMGTTKKARAHVVVLAPYQNGNLKREPGEALCGTDDELHDDIPGPVEVCPTCKERADRYGLAIPGQITEDAITMTCRASHAPLSVFADTVPDSHFVQFANDERNGEFIAGRGGGWVKFDGHYRTLNWVKQWATCAHCATGIKEVQKGVPARVKYHSTGNEHYPVCEKGHLITGGWDLRWKVTALPGQGAAAGRLDEVKNGYAWLVAAGAEHDEVPL